MAPPQEVQDFANLERYAGRGNPSRVRHLECRLTLPIAEARALVRLAKRMGQPLDEVLKGVIRAHLTTLGALHRS